MPRHPRLRHLEPAARDLRWRLYTFGVSLRTGPSVRRFPCASGTLRPSRWSSPFWAIALPLGASSVFARGLLHTAHRPPPPPRAVQRATTRRTPVAAGLTRALRGARLCRDMEPGHIYWNPHVDKANIPTYDYRLSPVLIAGARGRGWKRSSLFLFSITNLHHSLIHVPHSHYSLSSITLIVSLSLAHSRHLFSPLSSLSNSCSRTVLDRR